MTDNVLLPLGFPKRLNTVGDPKHPVYPPGEQGFEVQKMMVKVTNKGWAHSGPRNLAFEHLGKNRCPRNREKESCLREKKGALDGGGSGCDGV